VIAMYRDDHGPPHFHARHADGAAKTRIDALEPIESTLGRRELRFVLAGCGVREPHRKRCDGKAEAGARDQRPS
jgi:Domain of unknown function (DUF4160)